MILNILHWDTEIYLWMNDCKWKNNEKWKNKATLHMLHVHAIIAGQKEPMGLL